MRARCGISITFQHNAIRKHSTWKPYLVQFQWPPPNVAEVYPTWPVPRGSPTWSVLGRVRVPYLTFPGVPYHMTFSMKHLMLLTAPSREDGCLWKHYLQLRLQAAKKLDSSFWSRGETPVWKYTVQAFLRSVKPPTLTSRNRTVELNLIWTWWCRSLICGNVLPDSKCKIKCYISNELNYSREGLSVPTTSWYPHNSTCIQRMTNYHL